MTIERLLALVFVTVSCGLLVSCSPAGKRESKSLGYFVEELTDPEFYQEYYDEAAAQAIVDGQEDNELLSRARPQRPNSPIYYIRLPPSPYVLVPGLGYVSRPPSLRPPPLPQGQDSPLINVPVNFVSNGKPTGVYTWNPSGTQAPSTTPPPPPPLYDSQITNLDKGPYFFNGRPTDIFLLRNTYNTLYDDGLQNFYP